MSPIPGDNRQDPHDPNDDISIAAMETNIIIAAGSGSDSAGEDDMDDGYQGYQMLPQDPDQLTGAPGDDEDITMETHGTGASGNSQDSNSLDSAIRHSLDAGPTPPLPSHLQMPDADIVERKTLWNQPRLHPQEPMDPDHLNKIKSAMSGISLPGCNIPEWAKVLPEVDWKSQLLSRLQGQVPVISSNQPDHTASEEDHPDVDRSTDDPPNKRPRCSQAEGEESEETAEDGSKVTAISSKTVRDRGGDEDGGDDPR